MDSDLRNIRLKTLLDNFDDILVVLQKWIVKKILPDFNLLPSWEMDLSPEPNPVENYYRQTIRTRDKENFSVTF